jgi:hypothetical protein
VNHTLLGLSGLGHGWVDSSLELGSSSDRHLHTGQNTIIIVIGSLNVINE